MWRDAPRPVDFVWLPVGKLVPRDLRWRRPWSRGTCADGEHRIHPICCDVSAFPEAIALAGRGERAPLSLLLSVSGGADLSPIGTEAARGARGAIHEKVEEALMVVVSAMLDDPLGFSASAEVLRCAASRPHGLTAAVVSAPDSLLLELSKPARLAFDGWRGVLRELDAAADLLVIVDTEILRAGADPDDPSVRCWPDRSVADWVALVAAVELLEGAWDRDVFPDLGHRPS